VNRHQPHRVAADIDQKPPIATPMKARPIMKTV
jgi:hypothetical protein